MNYQYGISYIHIHVTFHFVPLTPGQLRNNNQLVSVPGTFIEADSKNDRNLIGYRLVNCPVCCMRSKLDVVRTFPEIFRQSCPAEWCCKEYSLGNSLCTVETLLENFFLRTGYILKLINFYLMSPQTLAQVTWIDFNSTRQPGRSSNSIYL